MGVADITEFSPRHRRAQISLALLRTARGKGIGSAVLAELTLYAKNQLGLHQLYALVQAKSNPISMNMFLSHGYKVVATLPQWHFSAGEYEDVSLLQLIL